ncbi:MAG: thiamine-phosphate kinase [Candidatus Omnitrophica bacterium]|jgi:thiamine-monophosphate kinase|nr:thiamine-phosphate kinase [Candidatus Omnitrophota bacterium]
MRIGSIGEFGLIEKFKKNIFLGPEVVAGSGDDCAVLKFKPGLYQLFTCDMIVEGVDFLKDTRPELVGRKALAVSISDIAACGGVPKQAVVSFGMPKNTSLRRVELIAKGLFKTAREFGVSVVGGDISSSREIVIDVSMLGEVEKERLCLRGGAKAGDLVMVSGEFGGSIKGKHLNFTPRLKEARFLTRNFKIHAMIDVSDGLIQDLGHILEQSASGALIYEDLIPLSRDAAGIKDALCSGEEFELLFTASRAEAKKIIRDTRYRFRVIGQVMPREFGLKLVDRKYRYSRAAMKGFRHF